MDRPGYEEWRATLPKKLQYDGDYDLRGLYNEQGPVRYAEGQHMTDRYKKPNHPTFSNQSMFSTPENPGGAWRGGTFVPQKPKGGILSGDLLSPETYKMLSGESLSQREHLSQTERLSQRKRLLQRKRQDELDRRFQGSFRPLPDETWEETMERFNPKPPPPSGYQRGLLTSIFPYEINEKEKKLEWAVPPLFTGLMSGLNPTKDVEKTPSMFNSGRGILSGMLPEGKEWALPGIISGALDSAQDPGRAMRGEEVSPERAIELGMNLLGGSVLTYPKGLWKAPPPGQANNFIGRSGYENLAEDRWLNSWKPGLKATQKQWDSIQDWLDNLGRLPTKNERDLIFKKYNLSTGHGDGKVRYLTPVDDTKYNRAAGPQNPGDSKPFDEVVTNEQFKIANPELFTEGKVTMDLPNDERGGSMASWNEEMTVNPKVVTDPNLYDQEYLDSLTSHELAHYPEIREGFAPGGNRRSAAGIEIVQKVGKLRAKVIRDASDAWNKLRRKMTIKEAKEYEAQYPGAEIDPTTRLVDHESLITGILNAPYHPYYDILNDMLPAGWGKKFTGRRAEIDRIEGFMDDAYFALGGEQNANLVQAWKKMTPDQRDAAGAPTNLMYDEADMPHRTGRKFVHPSKQIDTNENPTGGAKLIAQKLREYAADPGGRKAQYAQYMALYARHAKKYGYDDLPAAAKKFKLTPEEYVDFKRYVDENLPKELEPFRDYLEHTAMENGVDWLYQGRDFPGWPDTRMSTVKSTFQSLIDDPYPYLKEYGYPDPRDLVETQAYFNLGKRGGKGGKRGGKGTGSSTPGSPLDWDPKGKGGTPNHQEIDYFGFTRKMKPAEFLSKARKLVPAGTKQESLDFFRLAQKKGDPTVANPQLYVEWDPVGKRWIAKNHEGRHRSTVANEMEPDTLIDIHMMPWGGLKARDITEEMRNAPITGEDAFDLEMALRRANNKAIRAEWPK